MPFCLTAVRQTAGYGKAGRSWSGDAGSLCMSLTADVLPEAFPLPLLTLFTADVVRRVVAEETGIQLDIKWPNDLYHAGKKIGGILIQATTKAARTRLIMGIGLNVNQADFADELADTASSLFLISGQPYAVDMLTQRIATRFQTIPTQASVIPNDLRDACITLGQDVRILTPQGEISGRAVALSPVGGLILQNGDQSTEILEGTVCA